jgi:hypothetical protein
MIHILLYSLNLFSLPLLLLKDFIINIIMKKKDKHNIKRKSNDKTIKEKRKYTSIYFSY